ncbi:hypothetical protein [Enterocloster citroniae]|uniref:hypothetical protein n=1 Tax=Enterocloster citroniae TaxID=358743 RepID=UPI001D09976B|nr:hypothetical protein [Enterocloster citroniae]
MGLGGGVQRFSDKRGDNGLPLSSFCVSRGAFLVLLTYFLKIKKKLEINHVKINCSKVDIDENGKKAYKNENIS